MKTWSFALILVILSVSLFAQEQLKYEPKALIGEKIEALNDYEVVFDSSFLPQDKYSFTFEDIYYDHNKHKLSCFIIVNKKSKKKAVQKIKTSVVIPEGQKTIHYFLMGIKQSDLDSSVRVPENVSLVPIDSYRLNHAFGVYKRPYISYVTALDDEMIKSSFAYNYGSYMQSTYKLVANNIPTVRLEINYNINSDYPPKMLVVYTDDKKHEKIHIQKLTDGRYFFRMRGLGANLRLTAKAKKQFEKIMARAEHDALIARGFGYSQPLGVKAKTPSQSELFSLISTFLQYSTEELAESYEMLVKFHKAPTEEQMKELENLFQLRKAEKLYGGDETYLFRYFGILSADKLIKTLVKKEYIQIAETNDTITLDGKK